MKQNITLTISSLFTLALFTLHLTDDALHAKAGMDLNGIIIVLVIMLVLLYGTVELAGRRAGYIITLLGGLASAYVPFLHGMGPNATKWGFLFVWTLLGLGLSGAFSAVLSARGLWRSFRTHAGSRSLQG